MKNVFDSCKFKINEILKSLLSMFLFNQKYTKVKLNFFNVKQDILKEKKNRIIDLSIINDQILRQFFFLFIAGTRGAHVGVADPVPSSILMN